MTVYDKANRFKACQDGLEWVKGLSAKKVYETCHRADWMLWYLERNGVDPRRLRECLKEIIISLKFPLFEKKNFRFSLEHYLNATKVIHKNFWIDVDEVAWGKELSEGAANVVREWFSRKDFIPRLTADWSDSSITP